MIRIDPRTTLIVFTKNIFHYIAFAGLPQTEMREENAKGNARFWLHIDLE